MADQAVILRRLSECASLVLYCAGDDPRGRDVADALAVVAAAWGGALKRLPAERIRATGAFALTNYYAALEFAHALFDAVPFPPIGWREHVARSAYAHARLVMRAVAEEWPARWGSEVRGGQ